MMRPLLAAIPGTIFGIGLVISGMINPAKIRGFLDVAGDWDPSLGLVMGGAVGVTALFYPRVFRRQKPMFENTFHLPVTTKIEPPVLIGAGIFGIGWGLIGICPGPAFTALTLGRWEVLVFFPALIAGIAVAHYGANFLSTHREPVDEIM